MIKRNLDIVREKIEKKCAGSGRNCSEITLIAVSKTQPVAIIKEAAAAGLKIFGENKAQELSKKSDEFPGDIKWHFIGHLQTNKVKYIIGSAEYIHSLDSIKLAMEIEKRSSKIEKIQKVLLEINTSGESSKFGLSAVEEIEELLSYCSDSKYIEPVGFMTMAPYTNDESVIRKSFVRLRQLKNDFVKKGFPLTELSMGMTNDYEIAIEEGATMLRIGTAIFGSRNY